MRLQKPILITSEEEAWKALEQFFTRKYSEAYVEFQGWPNFDLIVDGGRYSSTIPAYLLSNLSYLQGILNTYYGRFVYDGDARNLKKYEKFEIELVYKVAKGSTEIKADATGLLNKLGEAMNKPSTQKVTGITLCALALILSGAVVISKESSNKRDIEIQRMKLLEKAIEKIPHLKGASRDFQGLFKSIIMSASDAQYINIGPQRYDKVNIKEIAERTRSIIEHVDIIGQYRVKSIRGYQNHYLIDLQIDKDTSIRARVNRRDFDKEEIDLLISSITDNTLVSLTLSATKIEDGYANAVVTKINI